MLLRTVETNDKHFHTRERTHATSAGTAEHRRCCFCRGETPTARAYTIHALERTKEQQQRFRHKKIYDEDTNTHKHYRAFTRLRGAAAVVVNEKVCMCRCCVVSEDV